MAKKIFLTLCVAVLFILALTTVGFAESNSTTKLGNEISSSMNKTERSMDDLVDRSSLDEAGQRMSDGVREMGNTVNDGMNDLGRGVEDTESNGEKTENRAVAGTTGNFASGEIEGTTDTGRNGMTRNAWIWIVMIVVALVIIAAVWYYATQQK